VIHSVFEAVSRQRRIGIAALCALKKMPTVHGIARSDMCYICIIPLELMTRARETTGRWYPTTRGSQVVHYR
jgi:hypothetical protein